MKTILNSLAAAALFAALAFAGTTAAANCGPGGACCKTGQCCGKQAKDCCPKADCGNSGASCCNHAH